MQLEREHSRKLEFNGYSSNRDERSDLLSHIECFEKAIAILSKEKEKLTTDVEKMKTRLRNAMHDIFKLEVIQFKACFYIFYIKKTHLIK